MEDGDEADSLFEGMVLFTPSQFLAQEEVPTKSSEPEPRSDDAGESKAGVMAAEPLDENLFSDLTIVAPLQALPERSEPRVHPSAVPSPPSLATVAAGTNSAATISRQHSRRKKRAVGLRIGYGRDSSYHQESNIDDEDDDVVSQRSDDSGSLGLDRIKVQIAEKLSQARQRATSVSAARKDAIKKRRQAAESLRLAIAKHGELEKQLEEACEAEDFEAADRISQSLAMADKERQALVVSVRQAESYCDEIESKMEEVVLSQVAVEEECASMLRRLSKDAEKDADLLLKNAETFSTEEMTKWLSSMEAVEGKKIESNIAFHVVNGARLLLNDTLEQSVEQDSMEKQMLCKKKDKLAGELQELLAMVKQKEKEIEENDSQIKVVDERIANVVSGYREKQLNLDAKCDELQSNLLRLNVESEALSRKEKEIEQVCSSEKGKGENLKELARVSADEAKEYEEVVGLRKALMDHVSKFREDRLRLAKSEASLSEDVQKLRQEISSTRDSLKELSLKKSSFQQDISSFKEKIIFIEKRVPELESEKKVAAAARNFKEAARIASEAKSLSLEKASLQNEVQKGTSELETLECAIEDTLNRLHDIEGLISSKEKEVANARFQRLQMVANAASAERLAALELGDSEEANLLLVEAQEAESELEKLKSACDIKDDELSQSSKCLISMELVASLGQKQLMELAESLNVSGASG